MIISINEENDRSPEDMAAGEYLNRCQRIPRQISKLGAEADRTHQLFVKALGSRSCLDSVVQLMGCHPQYLESFLKTQHYLLHMDGPLPFHYRHYIAIMAAARHQSSYLVEVHVEQFLQVGGDPLWLQGLHHIPQRLRNLNEINKILAHRPWLITKQHIENLLKIGEHCWSLAELVHGVVLLTHYHSLASFVFGCGISAEGGAEAAHILRPSSINNQCSTDPTHGNAQDLPPPHRRRRSVDYSSDSECLGDKMQKFQAGKENEEEMLHEETWIGLEPEKDMSPPSVTRAPEEKAVTIPDLSCYVDDPEFGYPEFARRGGDQLPVFRAQDYSWEDHGFSLVNRLYSDIGHLLDEKFRTVYSLKNGTMAKQRGCDSSGFKRGIWNYIHCMFGIRYDDYDYGEVNQFLERNLKVYLKTITCSPEKVKPQMFERYWKQFKYSEKVRVNLLILEARMQAELLYSLHAITHYMIS
uniref:Sestrin 4 n=1 Tax=Callorhinchus milii TaxID=7868 RepID=A0A4W3JNL6_CALMI|eukprot:gi/632936079/ref/XP_007892295.1/ PREDICTED: sestrin-1-like [Callorhinchus milii]